MRINSKRGFGVISTSIEEINNVEMRQMVEMKQKVKRILDSHKDNEKKEYISDDDLTIIFAMLSVFTEGQEDEWFTSSFDDFLKKQETEAAEPHPASEFVVE